MSPRYPANYPAYQDCIYLVPIPQGTTMIISFHDFDVEYDDQCVVTQKSFWDKNIEEDQRRY